MRSLLMIATIAILPTVAIAQVAVPIAAIPATVTDQADEPEPEQARSVKIEITEPLPPPAPTVWIGTSSGCSSCEQRVQVSDLGPMHRIILRSAARRYFGVQPERRGLFGRRSGGRLFLRW